MRRTALVAVLLTIVSIGHLSARAAAPPPSAVSSPAGATATASRQRIQVLSFGHSVQGRDIVAYRLGTPGGRVVLIVGNIHGNEQRGVDVAVGLRSAVIPPGIDLFVIDSMNPDGYTANIRENANLVDLNRNFSWGWGYIPRAPWHNQYSGEAPADQPETQAVQDLVRLIQPQITVFYHQDANRVSLSGRRPEIPAAYARLVGQSTGDTPCTAGCTGTAGSFVNHEVPLGTSFLVELPNSSVVTQQMIDRHVNALLTVMVM